MSVKECWKNWSFICEITPNTNAEMHDLVTKFSKDEYMRACTRDEAIQNMHRVMLRLRESELSEKYGGLFRRRSKVRFRLYYRLGMSVRLPWQFFSYTSDPDLRVFEIPLNVMRGGDVAIPNKPRNDRFDKLETEYKAVARKE